MIMKKYIAILIFISFLGLAAFSVVGFGHRMNGAAPMDNCLNSQVDGTPCPTSLMASLVHHTATYQTLFNTLIPSLILFLIFISVVFLDKNLTNPELKFLYQKLSNFKLIKYKARQKLISWLSLLENSPSF